jgi:methylated-DNA-[protein]-cysteine S-methyltransferase
VAIELDGYTEFQRAVVETLRGVPWGEVVTYGELAALAGYPNAQRAAGSVCAHNRFPLVVPCHRVVAANGIGRYGAGGVEYKRRLLELERVFL